MTRRIFSLYLFFSSFTYAAAERSDAPVRIQDCAKAFYPAAMGTGATLRTFSRRTFGLAALGLVTALGSKVVDESLSQPKVFTLPLSKAQLLDRNFAEGYDLRYLYLPSPIFEARLKAVDPKIADYIRRRAQPLTPAMDKEERVFAYLSDFTLGCLAADPEEKVSYLDLFRLLQVVGQADIMGDLFKDAYAELPSIEINDSVIEKFVRELAEDLRKTIQYDEEKRELSLHVPIELIKQENRVTSHVSDHMLSKARDSSGELVTQLMADGKTDFSYEKMGLLLGFFAIDLSKRMRTSSKIVLSQRLSPKVLAYIQSIGRVTEDSTQLEPVLKEIATERARDFLTSEFLTSKRQGKSVILLFPDEWTDLIRELSVGEQIKWESLVSDDVGSP